MVSPYNYIDAPLRMMSNNGTKQLWSATNRFEQEYYETMFFEDGNDQSDVPLDIDMGDILNMNKYLCHVCNIEVPKAYLAEHNITIKHKICKRIADIALERTRLHMQVDLPLKRKFEVTESYFCESCSVVVLYADEDKHKSSNTHRISVKHDELLSYLLEIYKDRENVKIDFNENVSYETFGIPDDISEEMLDPVKSRNNDSVFLNVKVDGINKGRKKKKNTNNKNKLLKKNVANIENAGKEAISDKICLTLSSIDWPLKTEQYSENVSQNNVHVKTNHNYQEQNNNIIDKNEDTIIELNISNNGTEVHKSEAEADKAEPLSHLATLHDKMEDFSVRIDELMNRFRDKLMLYESNTNSEEEMTNKMYKKKKCQGPSNSLVKYLDDATKKCVIKPIHTVQALADTVIQITAINGDKFKVSINNFHSFHVKANKSYCKICERDNMDIPKWHEDREEHMAKIMTPIKDRNGIRQLDDIWSHCVLCNDLTKNVDFHLQSLMHKNKLKHCLIEMGNRSVRSDKAANKDSKSNDAKEIQDFSHESVATTRDLMSKQNLVITNNHNYLNCLVCDVIVDYDSISVKQHVNSFEHLNNFEYKMEENRLMEVDAEKYYCIGCDTQIFKSNMLNHCNANKHKKLLQSLLEKEEDQCVEICDETQIILPSISQNVKKESPIDDSELICFVCNIVLYCIEEHMDSFEHKKNYYSYLETNKLNEIEVDTFFCIPCNTVITIDYLMSHCTGRKHRIILKNFVNNGEQDSNEAVESSVRVNDSLNAQKLLAASQIAQSKFQNIQPSSLPDNEKTMPLKHLYQFREMSNKIKLLCTVCDEEVFYTKKHAENHVNTLDHVVAFNLMMLWNKIKKRDDKYFCDICRLDMTYFSEISHVLGRQHVANLAKEPKATVYEYDRTLVTHEYAMSHKVGDRTRPSAVVSVAKSKK